MSSNVLAIGDLDRVAARIGGWIAGSVAAAPTPTAITFAITGYDLSAAPSLTGAIAIVGHLSRQVGVIESNAGTTITLSAALATTPTVGDPVVIYPQTLQVGAPTAWAVNQSVDANTPILTSPWAAPANGLLQMKLYIPASGTAATMTVDELEPTTGETGAAGSAPGLLNAGQTIAAGIWFADAFPVVAGYQYQIETSVAQTIIWNAWFTKES